MTKRLNCGAVAQLMRMLVIYNTTVETKRIDVLNLMTLIITANVTMLFND